MRARPMLPSPLHPKVPKDLLQAQVLLDVLLARAPDDISDMFEDLALPGRKRWQDYALKGSTRLDLKVRDAVRDLIGRTSSGGT